MTPKDTEHPGEAPQFVRDLAEGFSTQAKYSNRVWLALLTAATLVLFPETNDNGSNVELPFSLGSVPVNTYSVVGFFILAVLMISYCQGYAAAHKAARIAHEEILKLNSKEKQVEATKYLDMLVTSALGRVAPLTELTGFPRLSTVYYTLLKLVALAVLFGIPSTAIYVAFSRLSPDSSISIYLLSLFALFMTALAILRLLYLELSHSRRVARLYWTKKN